MKPKTSGNNIQLFIIRPVYLSKSKNLKVQGKNIKDEFGQQVKETEDKFIREAYLKTWMDMRDISTYGEYIGSTGKVLKNRTEIYNRTTGKFYNVAHSLEEIKEIILKENKQIGFKP